MLEVLYFCMLYFRRYNVKWSIIKHPVVGVSLHWLAVSGSVLLWASCSSLISGSQKVPAVCAINRERSLQTRCHASARRWPAGPLKQWRCSSGASSTARGSFSWHLEEGDRSLSAGTHFCVDISYGHVPRKPLKMKIGSDANRWTSRVFKCQNLIVHLSFWTCMLVFFVC